MRRYLRVSILNIHRKSIEGSFGKLVSFLLIFGLIKILFILLDNQGRREGSISRGDKRLAGEAEHKILSRFVN